MLSAESARLGRDWARRSLLPIPGDRRVPLDRLVFIEVGINELLVVLTAAIIGLVRFAIRMHRHILGHSSIRPILCDRHVVLLVLATVISRVT